MGASVFFTISGAHNANGLLLAIKTPSILLALSLLGAVMYRSAWRPEDAKKSRLFQLIAVILVVATLGVPFAIVKGTAFTRLTDHYLKVVLQALIVWGVCRTAENRLTLVRASLAGMLMTCLLAFKEAGGLGRLEGAYNYDANDLALIANLSIPLLLWYAFDKRNRWRWMGLAALPLPLFTILRSDSRGGMLGLMAMAMAVSYFVSRSSPRPLRRLFPAVMVMGVLAIPFIPASTIQRLQTIGDPSQDYNVTSEEGRVAVWKRGMGYAIRNPVLGVGMANFSAAEGLSDLSERMAEQGLGFKWGAAHSVYVEALAELGFIGGGALIALLFLTLKDLLKYGRSPRRSADPEAVLLGLLGVAMVGFVVSGAFLSWAYYPTQYLLMAIAYGTIQSLDSRQPLRAWQRPAGSRRTRRSAPRRTARPRQVARSYR